MARSRSDVSKSPPPPLSSPTFRFIFPFIQSGLIWVGLARGFGWLVLPSGPSLFCRHDSSFPVGLEIFYRPWMFGEQRIWGFLPVRDSINYPIFGIDSTKLFFLKRPHHTRIA
uniref:Uncharacterized protein n=1 Tax=Fagus sylvatica TaxID=28930 RepID=A0A2N9FS18_FAGSY